MSNASSKKKPGPSGDKPERAANFGGIFRILFTTITIFVVGQLAAGFIITVAAWFFGVSISGLSDWLTGSTPTQFVYILLTEIFTAGAVVWVLRRRKIKMDAIGLVRPKWNDVPKAMLAFVAFYAILLAVLAVVIFLMPQIDTDQRQDIGFNYLVGGFDKLLAFVGLVILPPLAEEVLVRGYLFSGLRSIMRFVPAGLSASFIFGTAHLQLGGGSSPLWTAAINTFVLSLVLVYLREKTASLWPGIMVHGLNNLVAFFAYFHYRL